MDFKKILIMNKGNSTGFKIGFVRLLLFFSVIVNLIKSDTGFYIQEKIPSYQNQAEISLNLSKPDRFDFTSPVFEISSDQSNNPPVFCNHICSESLKGYSLICYNNLIFVQLKSIEHIFILDPLIKILHKSNTHQSSKEDPLLS